MKLSGWEIDLRGCVAGEYDQTILYEILNK